jgi:hypothetical protein
VTVAASRPPALRRAFDRVERTVGKPLEEAVASRRYIDVIVLSMKVQLAVNRRIRRTLDQKIGGALNAINVPTRSDVRRLSRQLTVLTGEVRALSADIAHQLPATSFADAELNPAIDGTAELDVETGSKQLEVPITPSAKRSAPTARAKRAAAARAANGKRDTPTARSKKPSGATDGSDGS